MGLKVKVCLEFPGLAYEVLSSFIGAVIGLIRGRVSDTAKCGWCHWPGLKAEMVHPRYYVDHGVCSLCGVVKLKDEMVFDIHWGWFCNTSEVKDYWRRN